MSRKTSKWIWYYGDFEIRHSLKLHIRRQERNVILPAFWRLDDCYHNVHFKKEVHLEKPEEIRIFAKGVGNVLIDGARYAFEAPIMLGAGTHTISVYVANDSGLPCMYVSGDTIVSDESWLAAYHANGWVNAGCMACYTDEKSDPEQFVFNYSKIFPVETRTYPNGILYDFGKETFGKLLFNKVNADITIVYGESEEEALDTENIYIFDRVRVGDELQETPTRAFRYIFIFSESKQIDALDFTVLHEYIPLKEKGSFRCSDEMLNEIWNVSVNTFHLNSREFYLDGIKRDRWVWSGDALQSYMVNKYLFFDEEIIRRTIIALRGKDPVEQHINTILDYSFYWIISVYDYYEMSLDQDFVRFIYPRMKSLMDFCLSRLDENGFAQGIDDDWVFVDWSEIDKTGAVCAEQILLLRCLEVMAKCSAFLGEMNTPYLNIAKELRLKIDRFFWNDDKGAFIDSFESGKMNITRHANIFALLFGYASERQKESIIKNVLLNDNVKPITTPYFKFYELEAMCEIGDIVYITEQIKKYWGGMLSMGATSFWEKYDPALPKEKQFDMYGVKYDKSLCHAWGASPIYLIGKYYLGVKPTSPGYETFEVRPNLGGLEWMEGIVPLKDGSVSVKFKDQILEVTADKDGGTLIFNSKKYKLEKKVPLIIK